MRVRIWLRIYSDLPWPLLSSIGGISANSLKINDLPLTSGHYHMTPYDTFRDAVISSDVALSHVSSESPRNVPCLK